MDFYNIMQANKDDFHHSDEKTMNIQIVRKHRNIQATGRWKNIKNPTRIVLHSKRF